MIKFTFLSENKTEDPCFTAEHGLAIAIAANGRNILFDTGSSDIFIKNAKNSKIDLADMDDVVISHGHFDHTQGLPFFCSINSTARIYIHQNSFKKSFGTENGKLDKEPCGILWTKEEKLKMEPRFIYTGSQYKISDDIIISGTIPATYGCNACEMFYNEDSDGNLSEDDMSHEQFLLIRDRDENGVSRGTYLFSGCSHKGVIPAIRYARDLFPEEKIIGLIAGMHLYKASVEAIKKVAEEIGEQGIRLVMPVHCTGINAICELKATLGEICVLPTVGNSYEY